MDKYSIRLNEIIQDASTELQMRLNDAKAEAFEVTEPTLMRSIEGGRFLRAVSADELIDDGGYRYDHSVLREGTLLAVIEHVLEIRKPFKT